MPPQGDEGSNPSPSAVESSDAGNGIVRGASPPPAESGTPAFKVLMGRIEEVVKTAGAKSSKESGLNRDKHDRVQGDEAAWNARAAGPTDGRRVTGRRQ